MALSRINEFDLTMFIYIYCFECFTLEELCKLVEKAVINYPAGAMLVRCKYYAGTMFVLCWYYPNHRITIT